MSSIIVLAGSPSTTSRTVALSHLLAERLRGQAHDVRVVAVRELPAEALLGADTADPAVQQVLAAIEDADGVVVASPVYKAAYSGVLKTFLDLLPQLAFAGKVVLPLLTGAGPTHTLAVDYALAPVLSALGAHHVVRGAFVLDKHIERTQTGALLAVDAARALHDVVDGFSRSLHARLVLAAVR